MSDISASAIQSLRSRTGVSISAVKDALVEANGDEEKAIEILRKRGIAQAAKKADREQAEGLVFLKEEGNKCAVCILRCETDFVARDDNFNSTGEKILEALFNQGVDAAKEQAAALLPELVQKLGENITVDDLNVVESSVVGSYLHSNRKIGVIIGLEGSTKEVARDIGMHAAAMSPRYVHPEEVGMDVLAMEKEIWSEQLKKEGKPENMWEKIMMGKEKKFREENAITKQSFVKDPSKTVEQHLDGGKITTYIRVSVA